MLEVSKVHRDQRDRSDYINPQIPSYLHEAIKELVAPSAKNVTDLLWQHLSRWIDADTGKRLKNTKTASGKPNKVQKPVYRKPQQAVKFATRGRKLMEDTEHS